MPRSSTIECFGCNKKFKGDPKRRPVCPECRLDKTQFRRACDRYELVRHQRNIDKQAMRETRRLPREDAYNPMIGERLVEKMMRGEW